MSIISSIFYRIKIYTYKKVLTPISYAKSIGVKVGNDCCFYSKEFGSEPYLIEIGNHVQIAGNVSFWTHGGGWVLRNKYSNFDFFGKIVIKDNVYIGSGSKLLPGVTIGNNVIIAAMSVVTKSVSDNSIVAGNPARKIGNIDDFEIKMLQYNLNCKNMTYFEKKKFLLSVKDDKFIKK